MVDAKKLKESINKAYETEVVEESLIDDIPEEVWTKEYVDGSRHVRWRFRVRRSSQSPDLLQKQKIYGSIAILSEQWGQSYYPEAVWGIKFIKDGEYSTELNYNEVEYQIHFWISCGSN